MAARRPPPTPEEPQLNATQLRNRINNLNTCIEGIEAIDVEAVSKRYGDPQVEPLEASIKEALAAAFGHQTPSYNLYYRAASIDNGPHVIKMGGAFGRGGYRDEAAEEAREARQYITEGKPRSIALLKQAIKTLEIRLADLGEEPLPQAKTSALTKSRKVFVVHGHDDGAREAVARFLERLELEAIILFEQPDQGLTVIEKFEIHASSVSFAVVLMTPDDLGGSASSIDHQERARQNVIFELGYFVGKLGRGRAMLLRKGKIEMPSDLAGVIYSELDSADGWKLKLVRELKAAGFTVDANRAME